MAGATTTILCLTCKEIMDVLTWTPQALDVVIRCRRSERHRWIKWNSGDACPKCGSPMKRGENIILGD